MGIAVRRLAWLVGAAWVCAAAPAPTAACSAFSLKSGDVHLVGRNQDWGFAEGMVVVNKRGQGKTALAHWGENAGEPAAWTSRYGSVTFVQYGREVALGGMNEVGLVVHEQWLDGTRYPAPDARPSVSVDQFLQYLLDSCRTVDEVVAAAGRLRVRPIADNFTRLHFFAVDATGAVAVLDYLGGRLVVHADREAPVPVMTNDSYERALAWLDPSPAPGSTSSPARFSRLARFVSRGVAADADPVASAFEALDSVKQGNTQLQVVFDVKRRVVHFRSRRNPEVRWFAFDAFDYSCDTPSRILDFNQAGAGDVTSRFADYSSAANEALIVRAWGDLGHSYVYPPALQNISRYPERFVCATPR